MTNSRLTDPEVLEWRFPVRLEAFEIRQGPAAPAATGAATAVIRRVRFLEPMTATILSGHRRVAPYGMAGGAPGAVGHNRGGARRWVGRRTARLAQTEMGRTTCSSSRRRAVAATARLRKSEQTHEI